MKLATGTTVISNGTLVDGNGGPPVRDAAVVVANGKITFAGPANALNSEVRDSTSIDAHGALVIPGLVDCHTHLAFGGWRADEFSERCRGATYAEIAAKGGKAVASGEDIGTRAGAKALIAQCVDTFGAIHAMVNNAGNVRDRSFLKMSEEDFTEVLRVHALGTFLCAQEAALRMRDQKTGGSIVNPVSAAHFGNFGQTNYGGAKGAIASMTYTWALELARYGIRVNAISPSGTTRMSATAKVGGRTVPAEPFEHLRASLANPRPDAFVGDPAPASETEGPGCPFAAMLNETSTAAPATVAWTSEAEARLERVPAFIRPMARKAIERYAEGKGHAAITEAVMDEARGVMGM